VCDQGTNTWEAWYGNAHGEIAYPNSGWQSGFSNCYNKYDEGVVMDVVNYGAVNGHGWNQGQILRDAADQLFFGQPARVSRQFDHYYWTVINSAQSVFTGCPINGPGTLQQGFAQYWSSMTFALPGCVPNCPHFHNAQDLIDWLQLQTGGNTNLTYSMTTSQIETEVQSNGGFSGGCGASACGFGGGGFSKCECTSWDGCECYKDPNEGTYDTESDCLTACCI
jgi:hypothetical protein